MVWGGFSLHGKTPIYTISTRMNSEMYVELLDDVLIPFIEDYMPDIDYMQDNAAIHVSKRSMEWFAEREIRVLGWPARSPDLNPIENLWGILARRVYRGGKQYGTVKEFETAVRDAWKSISAETLKNLVNSMPNQIFETIRMNGKQTKY